MSGKSPPKSSSSSSKSGSPPTASSSAAPPPTTPSARATGRAVASPHSQPRPGPPQPPSGGRGSAPPPSTPGRGGPPPPGSASSATPGSQPPPTGKMLGRATRARGAPIPTGVPGAKPPGPPPPGPPQAVATGRARFRGDPARPGAGGTTSSGGSGGRGAGGPSSGEQQLSAQMAAASVSASSDKGTNNGNGANGNGEASAGRGATRGGHSRYETINTRPTEILSKKGTSGDVVALAANYFKVNNPAKIFHQYRVDIDPECDATRIRKGIVYQLEEKLGKFEFDGTMMFKSGAKMDDATHVVAGKEGINYTIKIKFVGEINANDTRYIQVMNLILKRVLEKLNLVRVRFNFYDPHCEVHLAQWKLKIWPGFDTSIRQHETDLLVNVDLSNKIMRTETVYEMMKTINASTRIQDKKKELQKKCVDQIIMTRYNNRTYKISDIDFKQTPQSTFEHKGKEVTFIEYFKKYGDLGKIKDPSQPLLVSMPTKQMIRQGITNAVLLVPELCNLTGLDDAQRADFRLMKDLADYTRPTPKSRLQMIKKLSSRIAQTPEAKKVLDDWNINIDQEVVKFNSRALKPENIVWANAQTSSYGVDNAEWNTGFRNNKMYASVALGKWIVVFGQNEADIAKAFVGELTKNAAKLGFKMPMPKPCMCGDSRTANYIGTINKTIGDIGPPDMVMVVIPSQMGDIYPAVKKLLCCDTPIPSQVVTAKVLNKAKNLGAIAQKVAVQMASKLGAEPWAVDIPLKGIMVVGYDSFHDTLNKSKSVGAVVSSLNAKCTRYHSSVAIHNTSDAEELVTEMKSCMAKALRAYQNENGALPNKVIIYRDGVGDGQIQFVKEHEIGAIRALFAELNCKATLTFIIVSKRVNTKFMRVNNGDASNPTSGTVIDDVVTMPQRYDFYLVSQSVRQGTVNPTSFNVIEDDSGLKPDHLQRLSYKLAHLYYNWPGTVRVPAPCQYAHKLANLVGQSIHRTPNNQLDKLLYYL